MSVKQIENLLALLEFFAARGAPVTLADVVAEFGWPRSSAFNILTTLVEAGYLYEPRARGGFYPSPKWAQVIGEISQAEPLPPALHDAVQHLADETGETVWSSAPSGLFAVFLDVFESTAAVRYATQTGRRVPIHVTASGQALLSQMPERDCEVILRKVGWEGFGPNAPKNRAEFDAQFAAGRARGWFLSASNYSADLGGVAVPVVINGRIFSITVAGPLYRVADKAAQHAQMIYAAIARIMGPQHSATTLTGLATPSF
ncbi:MAG: IclR family transcriptional regulator [Vannielia sp.]|uniref:IclR family transcriptional regulator n=1 Tax=Vannielia sp. TaxID=2813045 RepID=UPI003B8D5E48